MRRSATNKQEAKALAEELRQMMDKPDDWKDVSFENGVWYPHIQHKKAFAVISPCSEGKFMCMFDPEDKYSGATPGFVMDDKTYKNPNTAFRAQANKIRRYGEMLVAAAAKVGC